MPRTATALLIVLALLAAPALAAVNTSGDVKPVDPGFGLPIGQPGIDDNGDNIADWIDTAGGGNNVFSNLADPLDATGLSGNGLAWDDPLIWVDYETPQNILVGEVDYGYLEINGGSALRYQHLVLGGMSDLNSTNGLDLTTNRGSEDFDFLSLLGETNLSRTGFGEMTVTGVGSVFNNDPNVVASNFQAALNFAAGNDPGTLITSVPAPMDADRLVNGTSGTGDDTYDVHVGLLGRGQLNVLAGGRVEIQDALLVGTASTARGEVFVDGAGSTLIAYGRSEFADFMPNGTTPSIDLPSYIGGNGEGAMTISDSGFADFRNGLSIGAPNVTLLASVIWQAENPSAPDVDTSGEVTVTGDGSELSVAPTGVTTFVNDAALAVGELRDLSGGLGTVGPLDADGDGVYDAAVPDGSNVYGRGVLRIMDGALVNVVDGGDLSIGIRGEVEMSAGDLQVDGSIDNDGRLYGYGVIQAAQYDSTIESRIVAGDPADEPGNPSADPLRFTFAGNGTANSTVFTNRGVAEGNLAINAIGSVVNEGVIQGDLSLASTGTITNSGDIAVSGDVSAYSMTTTNASTFTGVTISNAPLRVTLNFDPMDNDFSTVGAEVVALKNLGVLRGAVDLETDGGVINGARTADVASNSTIEATGTIETGVFLNERYGTIRVGAGESLSILSNAADGDFVNPIGIGEDGTDPDGAGTAPDGTIDTDDATAGADTYTANIGTIEVNGGSFEIGRLTGAADPTDYTHSNYFRNARVVAVDAASTSTAEVGDEAVGTIVAQDANLTFRNGVYNTGIVSFNGGDNIVSGVVVNAGESIDVDPNGVPASGDEFTAQGINYDTRGGSDQTYIRPGVVVVSGSGTSVTFEDEFRNGGVLSVGPFGNVVNMLGDYTNDGGDVQLTVSPDVNGTEQNESAIIVVSQGVDINGGTLVVTGTSVVASSSAAFAASDEPASASAFSVGFSANLISGAAVTEDSLFTDLDLPELAEGMFWDLTYTGTQILLEVIESAAFGADFTGDGIVSQADIDVWAANAGINSGASLIMGDADLDGDVDLADYDILQTQLLAGVPSAVNALLDGASTVPEPATLLLAMLAGLGVARRP